MSRLCPRPIFDQYLSTKSKFRPRQIQYLSSWSNLCPLFVISLVKICQKNLKTKPSQRLDLTTSPFVSWLPCTWTKVGHSLDSLKSIFCPPFVKYQIPPLVSVHHITQKFFRFCSSLEDIIFSNMSSQTVAF